MKQSPFGSSSHVVSTVCPLDCPDCCSLDVTVQDGKVTEIDGSHANPVTGGYICAKVRRYPERVYGEDRLLYPAVRKGPKGHARFERVSWDHALDLIATRIHEAKGRWGGEAILPYSYGGSNGLLTQDTSDATLFRRLGTSRLARTVCAAATGAANQALYGKMPSITYQDFPEAKFILLWGVNPSSSGIHIIPYIREAQKRGAVLVVVDPVLTPLAKRADVHLPVKPGTDLPVALAIHRYLFEHGYADQGFLDAHTHGAARLREKAQAWTFDRAAAEAGIDAGALERVAQLYATTSPALVKCGWGQERNRNGGSSSMAILALPAVAGKFGVRGGGFAMSNTNAWQIERTWIRAQEPATRLVNMNHLGRALTEYRDPPVQLLFVYNSNAAVTTPNQMQVLKGLEREDLFTVVFDQTMTDTAQYADVLLPATTFLESYDLPRGYGSISLRLGQPVIEPVGEVAQQRGRLRRAAAAAGSQSGRRPPGRAGRAAGRLVAGAGSARGPNCVRTAPPRRRTAGGRSSSWTCFRGRQTGRCISSRHTSTPMRRQGSTAISPIPPPTTSRWRSSRRRAIGPSPLPCPSCPGLRCGC